MEQTLLPRVANKSTIHFIRSAVVVFAQIIDTDNVIVEVMDNTNTVISFEDISRGERFLRNEIDRSIPVNQLITV